MNTKIHEAIDAKETFQTEIVNRLETIKNNVEDRELLNKYAKDVKRKLVTEIKDETGGILPVCVDPITFESFFLFGVQKIRRKDCDEKEDYFYTDNNSQIHVRDVLCHFHGWIEPLETLKQGAAREGYEESRGLFGSHIDIWRCLIAPNKEFAINETVLPRIYMVSLGFLDANQRKLLITKFPEMEVTSPAMAEMSDVKFVSINALHKELQRIAFSRIEKNIRPGRGTKNPYSLQCNLTNVSPEDFQPDHSCWLREFLLDWFLKPDRPRFGEVTMNETREKINDPSLHPEQFLEFPSEIHLPGMTEDEEPLRLVLPTAEELKKVRIRRIERICLLCRASCEGAFYSCSDKEKSGRVFSTHIRCALRPFLHSTPPAERAAKRATMMNSPKWRVITEEELSRDFLTVPFFESEFLGYIRNPSSSVSTVELLNRNEIYPGLKAIDQLPPITDEAHQSMESAFRIGKNILEEQQNIAGASKEKGDDKKAKIKHQDRLTEKYHCDSCGRVAFCEEGKNYRKCTPCRNASKEFLRRRQRLQLQESTKEHTWKREPKVTAKNPEPEQQQQNQHDEQQWELVQKKGKKPQTVEANSLPQAAAPLSNNVSFKTVTTQSTSTKSSPKNFFGSSPTAASSSSDFQSSKKSGSQKKNKRW
jgi:hypothetical protein